MEQRRENKPASQSDYGDPFTFRVGEREPLRSFAVVMRGTPKDFQDLLDLAKAAGLYVVFTKTSWQKLKISEEAF